MKRIELKSISLQNFKGSASRTIEFGNRTSIFGANATGKTTIMDGFSWLLFDKDSTGATKFDIRPLDESGKAIDNIEISVMAVLDVDGVEVTLQKTQRQNWIKKRGAETLKFQGNTNCYEINGFPASEKEFRAKVDSIVSEDLFKLLTDPRVFAGLPWKKQREILLNFVSDVTDDDVLAMDPKKYQPIADELHMASVDKCLEKAAKALTRLKKQQAEIPARIDEAGKSIVEDLDVEALEAQQESLQKQIVEVRQQRDDAGQAFKIAADLQAEIGSQKLAISKFCREAQESLDVKKNEARKYHFSLQMQASTLREQIKGKEHSMERLQELVKATESEISSYSEEWKKARAMTLDESETICQFCGQALPEDKLNEVQEKFNQRKAALIERIHKNGCDTRKEHDDAQAQIDGLKEEIQRLKEQSDELTGQVNEAYKELISIPDKVDVSGSPDYKALNGRLTDLQAKLDATDNGAFLKKSLADKEKGLQAMLDDVNSQLALVDANDRAEDRISELNKELKKIGQQVADQEKKQYLLEEFSRAKMSLLSDMINQKFEVVNFKLFEMQINGGVKDTCEMTMGGVPYSSLNSAGRLQAGLDVIRALQKLYDVSAPIFIDNRESVSVIPDMEGSQVINLYVSEADKKLRIEVA